MQKKKMYLVKVETDNYQLVRDIYSITAMYGIKRMSWYELLGKMGKSKHLKDETRSLVAI
jgi:hypothetical protein